MEEYGILDAKPIYTPIDLSNKLSKNPSLKQEAENVDIMKYQSLIGSLLYLTLSTRPDIAYSKSILS